MLFIRTAVRVLQQHDYRTANGILVQLKKQINTSSAQFRSAKSDEENQQAADEQEKRKKFDDNMEKNLMVRGIFEQVKNKNKETYLDMINIFENRTDKNRRNHVEFIYAALKNMEHFGVQRDLEVYKALIDVMPKGKLIAQNAMQVEFQHYPKQQQCIIDLLEQMEDNGVMVR